MRRGNGKDVYLECYFNDDGLMIKKVQPVQSLQITYGYSYYYNDMGLVDRIEIRENQDENPVKTYLHKYFTE